jgi:hypothetical protein
VAFVFSWLHLLLGVWLCRGDGRVMIEVCTQG